MRIAIDGQEYWTRREYLPKSTKVALPAPDAYLVVAAGGKYELRESGQALYLPNRHDILAMPAVEQAAQRRKAAEEYWQKLYLSTAKGKREAKIDGLVKARDTFAGIGTRRAKLRLNKLARTSVYAEALRIALETEDANLTAKRYFGGNIGGHSYADINYEKKSNGIESLIEISKSQNWTFGIQPSDTRGATHVVYFDIPGVGQVSWHYTPTEPLPVYPGKWDGKEGSTLPKLEAAISALLKEKIAA